MNNELSIKQSNQLKAIAILMMVFLHLFNRDYKGLFEPIVFIGSKPLSFYFSLFCDSCVPIFAFVSGYGLYYKFQKDKINYIVSIWNRISKLYINYWFILIIFVPVLGTLLNKEGYPGSLLKFILNFTSLSDSYNSIWWFFLIYILLVISSNSIFSIVQKYSSIFLILSSFIIYLVSFYFRVYKSNMFEAEILNWLQGRVCLYGTTLFPFLLGAIALEYNWNSHWSCFFKKISYPKMFILLAISGFIIIHGIIPNFIIAPFLAIPFIFVFSQIRLGSLLESILNFIAKHSTNIWLIHPFFYMIYFQELMYKTKNVILIYLLVLLISIFSSLIINVIQDLVIKKINKLGELNLTSSN